MQDIEHAQEHVHQARVEYAIPLAQYIENVFGAMTNRNHRMQSQEPGAALDRMKSAKYRV